MNKGKEKDLGEANDLGKDKNSAYLDPGKFGDPLEAKDPLQLKPEDFTEEQTWQADPTGKLASARTRYFHLKQVFWKSARYAPITTLGIGGHGIAILYGEADTDGKLANRIVMKRALHRDFNVSIRKERRWLRTLSRAMHIVQEVPVYVSPEERQKLDNFPTLCLEYLQGGTLLSFVKDKIPKDKTIPSRLLWSFLLCRK
ncbi:hypothetical protein PG997_009563 [Apiospora hydei]|uniref:Protein kinase domain-containing protein n=1 Tax=Apiospora hydei TaxID=1337664 RepID=A0ABR1VXL9_9PEZI